VVLTVIAFLAILFHRPLSACDLRLHVGVLRWSWRVGYYSYNALGTDRYPPFSLAEHPDYPARLDVEYPQALSRGLVLVKWWLLALPHYLSSRCSPVAPSPGWNEPTTAGHGARAVA
jgi:hypothetical protein